MTPGMKERLKICLERAKKTENEFIEYLEEEDGCPNSSAKRILDGLMPGIKYDDSIKKFLGITESEYCWVINYRPADGKYLGRNPEPKWITKEQHDLLHPPKTSVSPEEYKELFIKTLKIAMKRFHPDRSKQCSDLIRTLPISVQDEILSIIVD